jgi:hypothetical protein
VCFNQIASFNRKRESQRDVSGCEISGSRLHPRLRGTTADRTATHRKLDQRRDGLYAGGPTGIMQFWGVGQELDAAIILNPLRRLHELSLGWLESLQKNDAEAQECRIRVMLADSGALKPKVFLFRR